MRGRGKDVMNGENGVSRGGGVGKRASPGKRSLYIMSFGAV